MALCDAIVGIPESCGDNNLGSIKRALIASFADVTSVTVTDTGSAPDTDGEVTAVTMETGTKFEEFVLVKDTSRFGEELNVDLVADTNSWTQTIELGFRRIDLRKRNAITLLAKSRRNLIAIVEDTNGDYWMLGSDQGLRLSAQSSDTQATRAAGQLMPTTLTSENERHMLYKVDSTIVDALLTAAV